MVRRVNDTGLEERISNSKGFVIVAFMGDCPPCDHFRPELKKLPQTLRLNDAFEPEGGIEYLLLDTEENPSAAALHKVLAVPTTILFKDGQAVVTWEGPYACESLARRICDAVRGKRV